MIGATAAENDYRTVLEVRDLTVRYGDAVAVDRVSLRIPERSIVALIGPSGCGKSTLLRVFNRMNDFVDQATIEGEALFWDRDIYGASSDPVDIRRQIGMVFQKPNPFPSSIEKNVSWAPRINGYTGDLDELVESSLRKAALWDEVKDELTKSGMELSGGQQQRLCIARTIAMDPAVILMDEPCSALDPTSTAKIESLIKSLSSHFTVVIVTHNMQQASRISDFTAFMYEGRMVEFGPTGQVFANPVDPLTKDYVEGRFG